MNVASVDLPLQSCRNESRGVGHVNERKPMRRVIRDCAKDCGVEKTAH